MFGLSGNGAFPTRPFLAESIHVSTLVALMPVISSTNNGSALALHRHSLFHSGPALHILPIQPHPPECLSRSPLPFAFKSQRDTGLRARYPASPSTLHLHVAVAAWFHTWGTSYHSLNTFYTITRG